MISPQEMKIIQLALIPAIWQTLYMVFFSTVFSVLLGLPLGIILVLTDEKGIIPKPAVNKILGTVINITRSFPFLILLILLVPLSRVIVGTAIGSTAAIVPLSIAAAPFVARIVESSLKEVNAGVLEAAQAMGSTHWEIVGKVLLPEALPSLILGFTLTVISLIGYSAMAGAIGGGGLGDIAIRYGYQDKRPMILFLTVIILILIVQIIQSLGNYIAIKINRK